MATQLKSATASVFLLTAIFFTTISSGTPSKDRRCEEINIPMCKGIGYNSTQLPNMFHHDSQEEAGLEVHQFWPLVEIQCSDDLRFFLCSMYTPICIEDYNKPLPACRSVCNRAKAGCAPIMTQYGFGWPDRMNCEELPIFGDQTNLCMDSKNGAEPTISPYSERFNPNSGGTTSVSKSSVPKIKGPTVGGRIIKPTAAPPVTRTQNIKPTTGPATTVNGQFNNFAAECKCDCNLPLRKLDDGYSRFFNRVETGSVSGCGQPCKSVFFKPSELIDANHLINIVAIACFVCTFLIVTTYAIDTDRFKYPEVSIVYMSGCYLMVSTSFLAKYYFDHAAVACDDSGLIRYQGMSPPIGPCLLVFILFYFFTMASGIYWVILCFTWYLAAGLKWGSEAIASYSPYFHLIALSVPTIKSLIILGMGAIDGDSFSGICSVGNLDSENLKKFVLIPAVVYLLVGGMFLLAGFLSLFRVRKVIRQQQSGRMKTDKLEKLMIRIVIFSILYVIPTSIVISCYYYEFKERINWERLITCPNCINSHLPSISLPYSSANSMNNPMSISQASSLYHQVSSSPYQQMHSNQQQTFPFQQQQQISPSPASTVSTPSYISFLSKYICSLVVGITSLFWILSPKTIDSWSKFLGRMCGCGHRSTVGSIGGRSSGGSQLIGSQYIPGHNYNRVAINGVGGNGSVYKQMVPINQQLHYSSTSHIGSDHNHRSERNHHNQSLHMKQVPLSHV